MTSCTLRSETPALAAVAHASAVAVGDRLRDEVVDELDHEAVAGRARVDDVFAKRLQHGLQRGERRVVGADHDVELAELGLDRRARKRRIDEQHA